MNLKRTGYQYGHTFRSGVYFLPCWHLLSLLLYGIFYGDP